MAKTMKIAVVGAGWAAGAHIEAFKQINNVEVVAVCSRQNAENLKNRFNLPLRVYPDFEQCVHDPDIDVVDICTRHSDHPDQTIASVEAGKHVIVEKPIAIDFDSAKRMRDAIRRTGKQVCVCFECRFSAQFQMVHSVIERGLIGRVHYAEIDYYHGIGPWYRQYQWNINKDNVGSSLLTAGCHALDALLMVMEDKVVEVTSYYTQSRNPVFQAYDYPTTSVTLVKFENGQVGKVVSCIDCLQPYYFHVHLLGSQGSLLDDRLSTQVIHGIKKNQWNHLATSLIDSGDVNDHPYLEQFKVFFDSLKEGRIMPLTNFETAFETHRVAFAADLSAAQGRPVVLDELH